MTMSINHGGNMGFDNFFRAKNGMFLPFTGVDQCFLLNRPQLTRQMAS